MKRNEDEKDVKAMGERKPYAAPTLTEHGAVEAVTEGRGVRPADGPLGT